MSEILPTVTVTYTELKADLSPLLHRAESGEHVIVQRTDLHTKAKRHAVAIISYAEYEELLALASEFGLDINQIFQDNLTKDQALPPAQIHKETGKPYTPSPAPPLKYATVLKKLLPINRYSTGKGTFAFRTGDIKAAARYLGIKWEHAEQSWNATLDALDRYDPDWRGVDIVDRGG